MAFHCDAMKFIGFLYVQLFIAFSAFPQAQTVDFHVTNLKDSIITVGYYFGDKRYVTDTLSGENGKFTLFSEEPLKPGLYFLYSDSYYFEFVMDTVDFGLSAEKEKGYAAVSVKNSEENSIFKVFRTKLEELQKRQKAQISRLTSGNKNDSTQARISLSQLENEMKSLRDSIQNAHPESFTASFIDLMKDVDVPVYDTILNDRKRAQVRYRYYRDHFLKDVDLGDPRLLRTPLLHEKVMKYFDQVIPQHPDTINYELDKLFDRVGNNQELFRYWLVTFFQKYEQSRIMGMDAVTIHLIENYYLSDMANWVTGEFEKKLREEVAFVKPNLIGNSAPALNVVDTLLQPFYLEQVEQPYLVLYFYDPDCGHCKKATKKLKEEYENLTNLGAEILSVCTITDVEKWKKYIRKNQLPWIHVADPYNESRFRVTYNVRSTPKIYVLGPERKIVAKQLEVEQLAELIERMQQ